MRTSSLPETRRDSAPVRLMTYNIHRWAGRDQRLDLDRLASIIRDAGADVVGLNEVLHPVTMNGRTYAPLAELADRLDMRYAFGPSGWLDYGPGWHGPVGNALLSRFPLRDATNTLLPRLPSSKQRSLLGAAIAGGPARGLTAFVTHLDHAFEGTRLLQIQGVLKRMAQHGPHFLVGDFNTPGFMGRNTRLLLPPVLRLLAAAGYQDAFCAVGNGPGRTFPSHSPLVRIDFLFLPLRWARGLRSARALSGNVTYQASDHRPLVVEWAWPQGEALPA
ncbi:MAG: Endonuclease/Exonuclease/phosphatase family protein [Chloroflexi bacterium ADurb.Bin325]|nr:MAG: Endonuclease/Exonuclease/phosphatase family protein [Chloroflexi bacterium ADurb.Bin325]